MEPLHGIQTEVDRDELRAGLHRHSCDEGVEEAQASRKTMRRRILWIDYLPNWISSSEFDAAIVT